jgi:hypothetical protein
MNRINVAGKRKKADLISAICNKMIFSPDGKKAEEGNLISATECVFRRPSGTAN